MAKNLKLKIFLFAAAFAVIPFFVSAASLGETVKFSVDPSFDASGSSQVSAVLVKVSSLAYFYVDENWWDSLSFSKQQEISASLDTLLNDFDSQIYPTLTSTYGQINNPNVDNGDRHVTVLFDPMKDSAGGYFNPGDGYSKVQYPPSNEREMVYLNALRIEDPLEKSFLAHEFMHLITFDQKTIIYNVTQDTWLNEAYSEYAPTLLGYDNPYSGSNLQNRVNSFLSRPQDSITEWLETPYDYGSASVFIHYLVDQYGVKLLVDALHSPLVGIASINYALQKEGYSENFSQVFTNWTVAVLVNDCNLGQKYCFFNDPDLGNLRIVPLLNFLPVNGEDSSLSIVQKTTNWAGNWQKITGGQGNLSLTFSGASTVLFKVPYVLCDYQGNCTVNFLNLDSTQNATLTIPDFSSKYSSITIIPSIQSKTSGFGSNEPYYLFSWRASSSDGTSTSQGDQTTQQLLAQIASLKKQISDIQAKIAAILSGQSQNLSCGKFTSDLYFGMTNSTQVSCLQQFLKSQGTNIYPQGLVTGNFLSMTQSAVKNYQAKEGIAQTGYFGPLTRQAANGEM